MSSIWAWVERGFIDDGCADRVGKGTRRALAWCTGQLRPFAGDQSHDHA
jgi:hypothetical protein